MSKKRIFDIEFPDDAPATPSAPAPESGRRSPMASAISENAAALRERAEAEAAIRAENDRLAHELVRLKKEGLITDLVPVDEIRTSKLQRDRKAVRDEDMDELKVSIQAVGLSNPIRVEVTPEGFELVQGYRRLTAYRELLEETGDETYARIPAGLIAEGEELEGLYRRMVDENLVRRDISFAEMADLARRYAAHPDTRADDIAEAVNILYRSASRQKRSYIVHFADLLKHFGGHIKWPEAIPRSLGLELEKRFDGRPQVASGCILFVSAAKPKTAEEEVQALRDWLVAQPKKVARPKKVAAKTTIRYAAPGGMFKCTASDGRLEFKGEHDFSRMDRQKLERAIGAFFDALDD